MKWTKSRGRSMLRECISPKTSSRCGVHAALWVDNETRHIYASLLKCSLPRLLIFLPIRAPLNIFNPLLLEAHLPSISVCLCHHPVFLAGFDWNRLNLKFSFLFSFRRFRRLLCPDMRALSVCILCLVPERLRGGLTSSCIALP